MLEAPWGLSNTSSQLLVRKAGLCESAPPGCPASTVGLFLQFLACAILETMLPVRRQCMRLPVRHSLTSRSGSLHLPEADDDAKVSQEAMGFCGFLCPAYQESTFHRM